MGLKDGGESPAVVEGVVERDGGDADDVGLAEVADDAGGREGGVEIAWAVEDGEAVTMINPRFTGRDSAGEVFSITADAAQRRRAEDGVVDLVNPVMRDAKGAELKAPTGYYDRDKGVLELYEAVNITDSGGYSFVSRGARLVLGEDRVEGLSPLEGKGPLGDIRADSYEILDGGNRVVFEGNVRTVIYPEPAEEPATVESEQDGTP
jgi:lipopolysaccharide export system protein LptC